MQSLQNYTGNNVLVKTGLRGYQGKLIHLQVGVDKLHTCLTLQKKLHLFNRKHFIKNLSRQGNTDQT